LLHVPQLFGSLWVEMQAPLHAMSPAGQQV
jgi:hypothetical protein